MSKINGPLHIERFWRSAKYERIYLNEYQNIGELVTDVDNYIEFYNYKRIPAIGYITPAQKMAELEKVA